MTATVHKLQPRAKMVCTGCGASANASCDCGVAYMPASEAAQRAIEAAPEKSNRAIAAETGLGLGTVNRARKTTEPFGSVVKRVGLDGKARKAPKPRLIRLGKQDEMPTEEEAEAEYQATLYDQACLLLESMASETKRKFFAHIRRKYRDEIKD